MVDGKRKLWSVNDNASNMKVAIRESEHLCGYFCTIHTYQLAVIDTFKWCQGMRGVLKKSKKFAKFVRKAPIRMAELKKAVEDSGLKFRRPKNPGQTRWDSQYDNMVSILPYKGVINNLVMNNPEWENRGLTAAQWKLLEGACVNLKHFKETNKALEGEKEPTINKVLERIYINHELLDQFINDPQNSRDKHGVTFAKKLKEMLEKRFPNKGLLCPLRRAANYLDPKLKGLHLREKNLFEKTKRELEEDWQKDGIDNDTIVEKVAPTVENNPLIMKPMSPTSKLREKMKSRTKQTRELDQSKIRKEMERYEEYTTPPKGASVLTWWKRHKDILPILSTMARAVLAVPASSAKSERVFSTGANVVTKKRTRMLPPKVEQTIIIKENKAKVEEFKAKTNYEIPKTGENAFLLIDIEEIVREAEEEAAQEEEEGAETFESDESEDEDDYDTEISEDSNSDEDH